MHHAGKHKGVNTLPVIDFDFSTPLDGNISNHISNQDMKMFTRD